MPDNLHAPDQEAIEHELRPLFDYGDIKQVSSEARIPYSTLTKQLNPDCIDESIPYQFLMFLYGCRKRRPALEEEVWALVARRRPGRELLGGSVSQGEVRRAMNDFERAWLDFEQGEGETRDFESAIARLIEALAGLKVREFKEPVDVAPE